MVVKTAYPETLERNRGTRKAERTENLTETIKTQRDQQEINKHRRSTQRDQQKTLKKQRA